MKVILSRRKKGKVGEKARGEALIIKLVPISPPAPGELRPVTGETRRCLMFRRPIGMRKSREAGAGEGIEAKGEGTEEGEAAGSVGKTGILPRIAPVRKRIRASSVGRRGI